MMPSGIAPGYSASCFCFTRPSSFCVEPRNFFNRTMRKKIKGALVIVAFALGPAYAQVQTDDAPPTHETVVPRGGREGWARLITANGHWKRHARSDSDLSDFIRTQTSINMDTTRYAADQADLKPLGALQVIFGNRI